MKYLIYDTEQEALDRAEQRAIERNTSFHRGNPDGTRYSGAIRQTSSGKFALQVAGDKFGNFNLSEAEQAATVATFDPMIPASLQSIIN